MALRSRRRTLLAKIETTYGTDPTPTGSANAILVSNMRVRPQDSELVSRDLIRTFFGNSEQIPVAIHAMIEFECEIAGAGAAGTAPAYGPLLRACGFAETISAGVDVQYTPVTDSMESVTIYCNVDGVLHKMLGARGNVEFDFTSRQLPKMKFAFQGIYVAVADGTPPTPTYTAWKTPKAVNGANVTGVSLHGYTGAVIEALTCNMNNAVVFRSLIGAELVHITDRKPAGQIKIEATDVATKDWWTIAKNAQTGALAFQIGTTAGAICKIDAPAVQLQPPEYEDSDGIQMLTMGLAFVPGSSGNDEFKLTVK